MYVAHVTLERYDELLGARAILQVIQARARQGTVNLFLGVWFAFLCAANPCSQQLP
jgi:hypothetical protein